MGYLQWSVSLIIFGLFTIAIIGFAVNFAADNNSPIDLADDPEINVIRQDIKNNLTALRGGAEKTTGSIINSSVSSEGFTTESGGSFAITPINSVSIVYSTLKIGYTKIFGSGTGFGIFITTTLTLIVLIAGLFFWKVWIGRNPE